MTKLECKRGPLDGLVIATELPEGGIAHLPFSPRPVRFECGVEVDVMDYRLGGPRVAIYRHELGRLYYLDTAAVEEVEVW